MKNLKSRFIPTKIASQLITRSLNDAINKYRCKEDIYKLIDRNTSATVLHLQIS